MNRALGSIRVEKTLGKSVIISKAWGQYKIKRPGNLGSSEDEVRAVFFMRFFLQSMPCSRVGCWIRYVLRPTRPEVLRKGAWGLRKGSRLEGKERDLGSASGDGCNPVSL